MRVTLTPSPALPRSLLQIEEDPTGGKLAAQMGKLGGAPHKLDNSIQFHVGDTITALARATMQPGGSEVLLYGTIMGGVGAFFPFQAKEVRQGRGRGSVQCRGVVLLGFLAPCGRHRRLFPARPSRSGPREAGQGGWGCSRLNGC